MFTVLKPLREKEASLNKTVGKVCSSIREEAKAYFETEDLYRKDAYLEVILNYIDVLEECHDFTIEDELDELAESLLMVDKLHEDCTQYGFPYMKSRFNKAFKNLLKWEVIKEGV